MDFFLSAKPPSIICRFGRDFPGGTFDIRLKAECGFIKKEKN